MLSVCAPLFICLFVGLLVYFLWLHPILLGIVMVQSGIVMLVFPSSLLFHRSVFDVLNDLWFMPKLLIYIKMIIGPFLMKIDKQQYKQMMHYLDNDKIIHVIETKAILKNTNNLFANIIKGKYTQSSIQSDPNPVPNRTQYNHNYQNGQLNYHSQLDHQLVSKLDPNQLRNILVSCFQTVLVYISLNLEKQLKRRLKLVVSRSLIMQILMKQLGKVPFARQIVMIGVNALIIKYTNKLRVTA